MNNELPLDFLAASYGLKSDDADTCDFCGNISGKDNLFAGIEASICVECAGLAKFTIDSLKGKLKTNRRMIMNKYRDKSDFEINKAVADELKLNYEIDYSMRIVVIGEHIIYNPCLNPSQAMPIVIENGISLISDWNEIGVWGATYQPWYTSENKNPLRAAMEVFLMMKEAENEK